MKPHSQPQDILLVDDDQAILALLSAVLTGAGYGILTAQNGIEAMHLALKHNPILAVLDMNMPSMDGLTLAQNLNEETTVPFVFLTAQGGRDTVQQATELGAAGYLIKPVLAEQVLPFISVSLARAQEMQRLKKREAYLQGQVDSSRMVGAAVGLLMAKHPINEHQAFQRLHDFARSHRQKIVDVARNLVTSQENLNLM